MKKQLLLGLVLLGAFFTSRTDQNFVFIRTMDGRLIEQPLYRNMNHRDLGMRAFNNFFANNDLFNDFVLLFNGKRLNNDLLVDFDVLNGETVYIVPKINNVMDAD